MDQTLIRAKLIEVLQTVQALSGEACPVLDDTSRPVDQLPRFTSKVWPVAAGMLGLALGRSIPCEKNIFVDDASKAPLAISDTVALVLAILEEQEKESVAA